MKWLWLNQEGDATISNQVKIIIIDSGQGFYNKRSIMGFLIGQRIVPAMTDLISVMLSYL